MWCDYFVTGCRTAKGFSVLLIERQEGVETSPIKTSYSTAAGTAFVEFNNVKVPVENLLGEEDKGFIVISKEPLTEPDPEEKEKRRTNRSFTVSNFNHERFMMCCAVIRMSRTSSSASPSSPNPP
jgi:hypothetical protein